MLWPLFALPPSDALALVCPTTLSALALENRQILLGTSYVKHMNLLTCPTVVASLKTVYFLEYTLWMLVCS